MYSLYRSAHIELAVGRRRHHAHESRTKHSVSVTVLSLSTFSEYLEFRKIISVCHSYTFSIM